MQKQNCVRILFAALLLTSSHVWAQQKEGEKDPRVNPPVEPMPPLSSAESSSKPSAEGTVSPTAAPQIAPDTRTLTGAEEWALSNLTVGRRYFQSQLRFAQLMAYDTGGSRSDFMSATNLHGRFDFNHMANRYQFNLNYSGGGAVHRTRNLPNSVAHNFGFSQQVTARRWTFLLSDTATVVPDTAVGRFGYGGFGMLNGLDGTHTFGAPAGLGRLNPNLGPHPTYAFPNAGQVSNVFIAQGQHNWSRRSAITFTGSHGLLRFLNGGLINSDSYTFGTGYNYSISGRDHLGIAYQYQHFSYSGFGAESGGHSVLLSYGRRVSGRMAFQLSGGPQYYFNKSQPTSRDLRTAWTARTTMSYQFRSLDVSLAYRHALTEGSGVFFGARSQSFDLGLTRQLSRNWSGNWTVSYSRSDRQGPIGPITTANAFNSWLSNLSLQRALSNKSQLTLDYRVAWSTDSLGGRFNMQQTIVSLSRPLARNFWITMNYQFLYNANRGLPCTGAICPRSLSQHRFGLSLDWISKPIEFD